MMDGVIKKTNRRCSVGGNTNYVVTPTPTVWKLQYNLTSGDHYWYHNNEAIPDTGE